ncbi:MAG: imidazoleglycerol-phosphate dehydratase [Candidatus Omnitrophica bacterium]|jgi:imidazoleglycerol-phosphate dehydratase|nr:imidazoleglycerol-phosphate dehydratase [Candidatus Omnitrophota bacterium]MDD5078874.1 imidazoleglycerol-phosphate dehydratase [Candidatus Omnitrophota bacterium]
MKKRAAVIKRKTRETDIAVKLNVDGSGKSKINTGIGFLDHMLELFAFWGLFDLEISTGKCDLKVDIHHTNEDVGIVLGQAFRKALADKKGIRRFGYAGVPMEEVVGKVVLDISGRGFFDIKTSIAGTKFIPSEGYRFEYAGHFFDGLAKNLGMNLNVRIEYANRDLHAALEPAFKALGIALDQATQIDPRRKGVPSTKGVID